MAKISKTIVVLVAATLCMVPLTGQAIGPTTEAQRKQAGKAQNPHQDACVLVEAFVVEVELSELYEQGVNPIGQKPNSVSVENILKCLEGSDIAQVTTGVKVAVPSGHNGKAKIRETIRKIAVPNDRRGPGPVRYTNYEISKTLGATASVRPGGEIRISFDFSENTYRDIPSTDAIPQNPINREWSGTINLYAGRPVIAGATQNEETAVFLVLCADITDM